MGPWFSLLAVTALVLTASCKRPAETDARASGPQPPSTNQQIFRVKGVIKELKPDGRIVALIPNSANWKVRRKILLGDWSYADTAYFDRDHIRFYDVHNYPTLVSREALGVIGSTTTWGS